MIKQRSWTPEQIESRREYVKAYDMNKRHGTPMPVKFYKREAKGWTTPAQNPMRIFQNPGSKKTLVLEENFGNYHSPELETIRFNNI